MSGEGGYNPEHERVRRVEEVGDLLAKIVEMWSANNPQKAKAARALVVQQFTALGITNEDGTYNLQSWVQLITDIGEAKNNPIAPDDYPPYADFRDKMIELGNGNKEFTQLLVGLQSRTANILLSKYLHGLGIVMSSRIAYESIFGDNDPIRFGGDHSVQNGRHRFASLQVLQSIPYNTTPWREWIKTDYE